jgi:Na+/H+ antiporter NhaD/arsenite permease-like protein
MTLDSPHGLPVRRPHTLAMPAGRVAGLLLMVMSLAIVLCVLCVLCVPVAALAQHGAAQDTAATATEAFATAAPASEAPEAALSTPVNPDTAALPGPDIVNEYPGELGELTEHHGPELGTVLPLWSVLPFIGILLSIAVFPLAAPHFWHHHFPKISALWALIFAVPFLTAYGNEALQSIMHIYLLDYFPFIILLWALFTAAGGIYVGGALRGSPRVNLLLLLVGTFLASWIGTTGAAMVMIRPVLRANSWRRHQVHTIVFFIFLVANIGGSLTPLGDPPLFLGFLHGVPFFWVTTGILREMLLVSAVLLAIYFLLDSYYYRREETPPAREAGERGLHIEGLHNLIFLLGVMGGVIFSGAVNLGLVHVYGHVSVPLQNWVRDGWLILMGALSLAFTARETRRKNGFSWFPIQEVGYLFAGIFMTIIPALAILQVGEHGALAPLIRAVKEPIHYFWVTGALSSFLDNAPTYLTFFNTALGSHGAVEAQVPGLLGYLGSELRSDHFVHALTAVSAGAVFMGAMTYIGNAPNFMVKSIAEEAGVPMPSFFGYMLRFSLPLLIPAFVIVTLVFFR